MSVAQAQLQQADEDRLQLRKKYAKASDEVRLRHTHTTPARSPRVRDCLTMKVSFTEDRHTRKASNIHEIRLKSKAENNVNDERCVLTHDILFIGLFP